MFPPIPVEELQLFLWGKPAGGGRFAKAAAEGSISRLALEHHAVALVAERIGQKLGLSGLSSAIDAFENDEMARIGTHGSGKNWGRCKGLENEEDIPVRTQSCAPPD